jgi:hypothetical protein
MQAAPRNLSTVNIQFKLPEIIMFAAVRIRIKCTEIVFIFNKANSMRLGKVPKTALSIDSEADPAANVKVLTSTLVT